MPLDTNTYRIAAEIIVQLIREFDETAGDVAQEYVDATIGEREGTEEQGAVQKVLDKLPKTEETSPNVGILFVSLFNLTLAYSIGK